MNEFRHNAEKYLTDLQQQYMDYLEEQMKVTSMDDYFQYLGIYDEIADPASVREILSTNEYPLESLFQVAPAFGQEVVLVSSNPGMTGVSKASFEDSRHYGRQSQAGDDIVQSAEILARNLHGYLTDSPGFRKIIPQLQTALDELPSTEEIPFEDYVKSNSSDALPPLFEDIYYTRVYKLPTPDENALRKRDIEFGKQTFQSELTQIVDPNVVVCTGAIAWRAIYESVPDPTNEIIPYNDSTVTSSFKKHSQGGARSGLFKVEPMDSWVVTTKHGSWPVNTDRLEENLAVLNQLR